MISTNAFKTLAAIDVSDVTKAKGGMTYLPWAWAWAELKKLFPRSYYTIYENKDGLLYHHDGKTCWVKTGVTLVTESEDGTREELEHIEYLPVMNMKNQSIPLGSVDSFSVNKAIQRSLTKAVARHGLGLYIYAGEDLPEEEAPPPPKKPAQEIVRTAQAQKLYEAVEAEIGKLIKGKSKEEQKPIAARIKALIGTANYRAVTDEEQLRKLYQEFVKGE